MRRDRGYVQTLDVKRLVGRVRGGKRAVVRAGDAETRLAPRLASTLGEIPAIAAAVGGTRHRARRERPLDPNYSVYASEQYEVATITLEVYQRAARKLVWADQETLPLRTVARRFGRRLAEDWSETGDERRWRVDDMVDALVGRLPE